MKRLMGLAIALTALAGTTKIWWGNTANPLHAAEAGSMPSLQDLHNVAGANKLIVDEIDDRSLVCPSKATY